MIPAVHKGSLIYAEHYTRYLAAQDLVRGKRVLDIASGSGYGSHLLAATAASVIGVDRDADAVAYARHTYGADNLEYREGDAVAIPVEDASVDVVITFETIEHVEDYRAFLREVDRVLAPDGIAVVSTPNDLEFAEGNHFHLHEFVADELDEVVGAHFAHIEHYYQATWKAVGIGTEAAFATEGPWSAPVLNLAPLAPEQFLYFYLVCSRRPITERIEPLVALGGHYSDRTLIRVDGEHHERVTGLQGEVARLGGELAAAHAEVGRLTGELSASADELAARRSELDLIHASRAYRLSLRLGRLWRLVRRTG